MHTTWKIYGQLNTIFVVTINFNIKVNLIIIKSKSKNIISDFAFQL